jgi:hypothetical protein
MSVREKESGLYKSTCHSALHTTHSGRVYTEKRLVPFRAGLAKGKVVWSGRDYDLLPQVTDDNALRLYINHWPCSFDIPSKSITRAVPSSFRFTTPFKPVS